MSSIRRNRRFLGAVLLTLVCFVISAAPAAAFDERTAAFEDRAESRIARLMDHVEAGFLSLFEKLNVFFAADGATIVD